VIQTFLTWHLINQECLPWFGNDLERIVWEVDVMQLIAITHATLGKPGDSISKRLEQQVEDTLVVDKLRKLNENPDA